MHNNKKHELSQICVTHIYFILRKIALNIIEYSYNHNIIIMYSTITLVIWIVIRVAHQSLGVETTDDIIEYEI